MNPVAMTVIFVVTLGAFAWSASRRWRLAMVAQPDPSISFDPISLEKRLQNLVVYAFGQKKMPSNERYRLAGLAHVGIFGAFLVLGINSVLLWVRGYDASFDFWGLLSEDHLLGQGYSFVKELFAFAAIVGGLYFVYARLVVRPRRMTLTFEGLLILGIIITMMIADFVYVGGRLSSEARIAGEQAGWHWYAPFGSAFALAFSDLSSRSQTVLEHAGYWWHASWVLLFLNLLPYSKHFHVITSFPNVFFQPLDPFGKLPDVDDIEGKIEREEAIGVA